MDESFRILNRTIPNSSVIVSLSLYKGKRKNIAG